MLMESKLLNGRFEMALRALLILGKTGTATLDQLLAFDFITTSAASFNLDKENLHGNNVFNYSEISPRRQMIDKGIGLLRMYNLVDLKFDEHRGYEYYLTKLGKSIEHQLNDHYAHQYCQVLAKVLGKYSDMSCEQMMNLINVKLLKELR